MSAESFLWAARVNLARAERAEAERDTLRGIVAELLEYEPIEHYDGPRCVYCLGWRYSMDGIIEHTPDCVVVRARAALSAAATGAGEQQV